MPTEKSTWGSFLSSAMEVGSPDAADEKFELLVSYVMKNSTLERVQAEARTREALGYYAGYYSEEVRERVERLYHCTHPILGPVSKKWTPDEIFKKGMEMGEMAKRTSVWDRLD